MNVRAATIVAMVGAGLQVLIAFSEFLFLGVHLGVVGLLQVGGWGCILWFFIALFVSQRRQDGAR